MIDNNILFSVKHCHIKTCFETPDVENNSIIVYAVIALGQYVTIVTTKPYFTPAFCFAPKGNVTLGCIREDVPLL